MLTESQINYFKLRNIPWYLIDCDSIPDKLSGGSKIKIRCSICNAYRLSRIDSIIKLVKRTGICACKSCGLKNYINNNDVSLKIKNGMSNYWKESDSKIKQSERSKNMWMNESSRNLITINNINSWNDQIKRKASSDTTKKSWDDDKRRHYKNIWSNDEFVELHRKKIRELWLNDEYRKKTVESMNSDSAIKNFSDAAKILWLNDDYRKRVSSSMKNTWNNERREKHAILLSSIFSSGRDSSIERTTQEILSSLSIEFVRQHPVGPYLFDLFIPSHNLLIEYQGEYWHSLEKAKRNDASKFTYIDDNFPQYKILYLYERDFLNPGIIKQKLIKELFQSDNRELQKEFSFNDVIIKELSVKEKLENSYYSKPEEFLQSFHYAKFGRSAKIMYGAFLNEELVAVCKFSPIVRKEVATFVSSKTTEILELDRFCIHPSYQKKNLASWFISRCSKLIKEHFKTVKFLVSFADSTFGHSGTIYKAANWIEVGKVKPSYHYITPDGWVLHKKTLWNHAKSMKMSENEYAEKFGFLKVDGEEKTKYYWIIK